MTDTERAERRRLEATIDEIREQLQELHVVAKSRKEQVAATRRTLWQEGARAPTDFEDQVELVGQITELNREEMQHALYRRMVDRFERLMRSPYFARVDFRAQGENDPEAIYIGTSSLVDRESGEHWVYDWRAPISGMYYDYELGEAGYPCEDGRIEGEITLKRQYRIVDGKLVYLFDSGLKIDDEILQEMLSKHVDDRMRTIITSIQREQNRVIRDEHHRILFVQGPAGSGKTSIALHRVAYLLYRHRHTLAADNMIIFSPNRIFSDYIGEVLPELGEENVHQTTFDEYASERLGGRLALETRHEQMEYLLSAPRDAAYRARVRAIQFKASGRFLDILRAYVDHLTGGSEAIFQDVTVDGDRVISGGELAQLFRESYTYLPYLRRMEKLKQRVLFLLEPLEQKRVEAMMRSLSADPAYDRAPRREIRRRSRAIVAEKFRPIKESLEAWTATDAVDLYRRLFSDRALQDQLFGTQGAPADWGRICKATRRSLGEGKAPYEDVVALLYLQGALSGVPNMRKIQHVVIDEAQDYSALHYEVIYQLFPHSRMTLLGDPDQAIHPHLHLHRIEQLEEVFGSVWQIRLNKSYRSTRQIVEFARGILPPTEPTEVVERNGPRPTIVEVPAGVEVESYAAAVAIGIASLQQAGMRQIAVICKTAAQGVEAHRALQPHVPAKLVTADDDLFQTGIVVIPSYLAKGLEFDAVVLYQVGGDAYADEGERKLLYTACTRALHRLLIYYSGRMSPFIDAVADALWERHSGDTH